MQGIVHLWACESATERDNQCLGLYVSAQAQVCTALYVHLSKCVCAFPAQKRPLCACRLPGACNTRMHLINHIHCEWWRKVLFVFEFMFTDTMSSHFSWWMCVWVVPVGCSGWVRSCRSIWASFFFLSSGWSSLPSYTRTSSPHWWGFKCFCEAAPVECFWAGARRRTAALAHACMYTWNILHPASSLEQSPSDVMGVLWDRETGSATGFEASLTLWPNYECAAYQLHIGIKRFSS